MRLRLISDVTTIYLSSGTRRIEVGGIQHWGGRGDLYHPVPPPTVQGTLGDDLPRMTRTSLGAADEVHMLNYNEDVSECCNWVRLLSRHHAEVHFQHETVSDDDGERVQWSLGVSEVGELMKWMSEGKVA
eukprot:5461466-Pyramimonas_sp.AAC.1